MQTLPFSLYVLSLSRFLSSPHACAVPTSCLPACCEWQCVICPSPTRPYPSTPPWCWPLKRLGEVWSCGLRKESVCLWGEGWGLGGHAPGSVITMRIEERKSWVVVYVSGGLGGRGDAGGINVTSRIMCHIDYIAGGISPYVTMWSG